MGIGIFACMKQLLALLLFIPLFAQAQFKVTVSKSNAPVYFRGTLFDDKNYLAKDTLTGTVLSSTTPIKGGIYYLQFSSTKERIYFTIENKEQFSLTYLYRSYTNTCPTFLHHSVARSRLGNPTFHSIPIPKGIFFYLICRYCFLQSPKHIVFQGQLIYGS